MCRIFVLSSLLLLIAQSANADDRNRSRFRIGRVEFGIPFADSFLTIRGNRTTVRIFSRGDIANVRTRGGTRVDVGIRSLLAPRRPQLAPAPGLPRDAHSVPQSNSAKIDLGKPQPIPTKGGPRLLPRKETKEPNPVQRDPRTIRSSKVDNTKIRSPLHAAQQANAGGKYRIAEKSASQVLRKNKNDHAAYSIRAAALIGQGEKARDMRLIRRGIKDIHQAIRLGKQNGDESKRDYLVWLIGMNQLSAMNGDRRQAKRGAKLVDDFTRQHVDKFPDELKEQVYHQQGFARLLLGKRSAAAESFRNAGKFSVAAERRGTD